MAAGRHPKQPDHPWSHSDCANLLLNDKGEGHRNESGSPIPDSYILHEVSAFLLLPALLLISATWTIKLAWRFLYFVIVTVHSDKRRSNQLANELSAPPNKWY